MLSFVHKRYLLLSCFLFSLLPGSYAQTYTELYSDAYIALAAVQDGHLYAMRGTLAEGKTSRFYSQLVNKNSDNEIVYLASKEEFNDVKWHVWIETHINLKSESTDNRLYIKNHNLTVAYSNEVSYFTYSSTYKTFIHKDNDNTIYGITRYGDNFSLQNKGIFTSSEYALAKPYFFADHVWRTLRSSSFGTICFSKAVRSTERAGATFYEIESKITQNGEFYGLVLREVSGELQAGVPYIFKKDDEATFIVAAMHGDEAEATSSNGLVGTLSGTTEDPFVVPSGMFVLNGDKLIETTEGRSALLAGRAYINPADIAESVDVSSLGNVKGIVLGAESSFDHIMTPFAHEAPDTPFFDLQGRPVWSPQRGKIYLVNGRKILVR